MKYDLVFEGGGAKGYAFVGALEAFEAAGHEPGRVLGTSAGAITATLISAGYTTTEVRGALGETAPDGSPIFTTFLGAPGDFTDGELNDGALRKMLKSINIPGLPESVEQNIDDRIIRGLAKNSQLCHVLCFFERGGWYGANAFLEWMRRRLNDGTVNSTPRRYAGLTLAEFHAATGRELTLIAADTTDARKLILNHRTAPGVPVEWAARMSMSVPLLWEEVIWQAEWGPYRGRDLAGHSVVDGGLLSNFPIELLLSSDEQVRTIMGDSDADAIAGFLIDETIDVPDAPAGTGGVSGDNFLAESATLRRLAGLVNTATRAADHGAIEEFSHLVVHLPAKGYGTTEFAMTGPRRDAIIAAGKQATEDYLKPRPGGVRALAAMTDTDLADRRAVKILEE
jgi:predicted acylesterase/phospholipase RssA